MTPEDQSRRPLRRRRSSTRGRRTVITHNPRLRHAYYELRVFYDGGINEHAEHVITKAAGSQSVGSGCCLFGKCTRDMEWEFVRKDFACHAAIRVLRAAQKHQLKGNVRVEVWDTKPRRVYSEGPVS